MPFYEQLSNILWAIVKQIVEKSVPTQVSKK